MRDRYDNNVSRETAAADTLFNEVTSAMKQGSTLSYLHHDHVGSLVAATDPSGAEVGGAAWARYSPFGQLRLSGGSLPSDRLFTGQTRDNVLGVGNANDAYYFFKARYYDATIGQFQSADTVLPKLGTGPADPRTLNRYAYARNNPLQLVDPTGHMYDDPSDGTFVVHPLPTVPPDVPVLTTPSPQTYVTSPPASPVANPPAVSRASSVGIAGDLAAAGVYAATGRPGAALGALGQGVGSGIASARDQAIVQAGFAALGTGLGQLDKGGGMRAMARMMGVSRDAEAMAPFGAMERGLVGDAVPALGGVVNVAQGIGAGADLVQQYHSGHGDWRRMASDGAQVLGAGAGVLLIGAVVVGAAPGIVGALAITGAALTVASAVPYVVP